MTTATAARRSLARPLSAPSASSRAKVSRQPTAFGAWRLDVDFGGPAAVRVSEFAEMSAQAGRDSGHVAYSRPANKRDLGHRCVQCRQLFSALGGRLVAEAQRQRGGPAPRFHEECWQQRCEGVRPLALEESVGKRLCTATADEWRRSSLDGACPAAPRRCKSAARRRTTSVLDGLVSVQDGSGDRRISLGFSQGEIQTLINRWRCQNAEDECAICLYPGDNSDRCPVRLPCGHVFCADCVAPWLKRCALCPTCRRDSRSVSSKTCGFPIIGNGVGIASKVAIDQQCLELRTCYQVQACGSCLPAALN